MMASIAPFWDGNETWLVMGGAGLLVAFPLAYSIVMPAFYLPVIVMLLALVFRGVAFEFREVAQPARRCGTSPSPAARRSRLLPGRDPRRPDPGHPRRERRSSPAARSTGRRRSRCCAGSASLAGYALLGATWLVMKTEGPVAERARAQAKLLLLAVLAFMAAVSLWTPLAIPAHRRALVLAAELLLSLAGAAAHRADRVRRLARAAHGARRPRRSSPTIGCSCSASSAS